MLIVALVVAAHFAFMVYLVIGGFLAVPWPRTFPLHLGAVGWAVGIVTVHWDCPLTGIERWARRHGGMAPLGSKGFIEHYITGVLYPEAWVAAVQVAVFVVVAVSWALFGWSRRHRGVVLPDSSVPG